MNGRHDLHATRSRARAIPLGRRIESAALYGALTLIGAVVLGTLSVHPF